MESRVLVETTNLISISDASARGISALVREAEQGRERILVRNNQPVAALIAMSRLEALQQHEDDLLDIALASARMLTTGPVRHSLDDVLVRFGYTREQLNDLPDE